MNVRSLLAIGLNGMGIVPSRCDGGDQSGLAEPRWTGFRYVAAALAQRREKWLIVIDVPEDFTRPVCTSPLGQTLQGTTLQTHNLPTEIVNSFEIVVRPVGPRLPAGETPSEESSRHAPLVYYCDPNWRVWHFSVGFPTRETLLADANWVMSTRNTAVRLDTEEKQRDAVAMSHREALAPVVAQALEMRKRPRASVDDRRQIAALIDVANQWRLRAITRSIANRRTVKELAILAQVLAHHGVARNEMAHRVLAERPLLPLEVVSLLTYQAVNESTFWDASSRRGELFMRLDQQRQEGTPVLLVVQPNSAAHMLDSRSIPDTVWTPGDRAMADFLANFLVAEITHAEFQLWLADARRELPEAVDARRRVLIVLDKTGQLEAIIGGNSPEKKLRSVLTGYFPSEKESSCHATLP